MEIHALWGKGVICKKRKFGNHPYS
jgi:hypothetical protein